MKTFLKKIERLPKEQKTFIGGIVIGSLAGVILGALITGTWVLSLIY